MEELKRKEEYNVPGDVAYERESEAGRRSVRLGSTQGLEALGGGVLRGGGTTPTGELLTKHTNHRTLPARTS
jgi:hypothetical protein